MDNSTFSEINTTLNLNGPILSFTSDPTGATGIGTTLGGTEGGTVNFTAKATASLLGANADGTGYLSYEWHEVDRGKVIPTDFVTGAASTGPIGSATTLTITNLKTPDDNQRKFFVKDGELVFSVVSIKKKSCHEKQIHFINEISAKKKFSNLSEITSTGSPFNINRFIRRNGNP